MKRQNLIILAGLIGLLPLNAQEKKYPERAPMTPAMTEYWLPQPPVVTPDPIPSDAIVLFDGKNLSQWVNSKGAPAEWTVHNGVFTVKKGTGDIQTK
ncbi:MAG TPA: DUF1080 domain-containing protein, partial [Porphyromonadaceae bacterium]|nr:DUF1080 domain-containing protein [Porphyromonadaceae bacterium]